MSPKTSRKVTNTMKFSFQGLDGTNRPTRSIIAAAILVEKFKGGSISHNGGKLITPDDIRNEAKRLIGIFNRTRNTVVSDKLELMERIFEVRFDRKDGKYSLVDAKTAAAEAEAAHKLVEAIHKAVAEETKPEAPAEEAATETPVEEAATEEPVEEAKPLVNEAEEAELKTAWSEIDDLMKQLEPMP